MLKRLKIKLLKKLKRKPLPKRNDQLSIFKYLTSGYCSYLSFIH